MKYKLTTLSSGLKLLTVPMDGIESVTTAIWVKVGSRFEEKRINGISHFLEHMVFKGSKKRPSARSISSIVDSIGGEFNAATSKDWTNFYIKSRVENLATAMDVLSDMVLNPLLKPEEIEREKGTIIQEIAMYEDTPMINIGDVFEELIFDGNPLGWNTAGKPENVKVIKKGDFVSFRKKHYLPNNMLISVVGGVSHDQAQKLAEKYFSSLVGSDLKLPDTKVFESDQTEPQVKLKTKKVEQAHLIMGFTSEGRNYEGRFAQSVLSTILGGGMSSRMFIEVRERRGLAYSTRTDIERYQEVGYLSTYAGVDVSKIDEAIKVMLDQYYGISNLKYKIEKAEIKKAKEYLKGHLALALEDTKDVTSFFADQVLFKDKVFKPDEIFQKIDDVSLDDVVFEAKKLFIPSKLNLAIIGPFKNQKKFVQLLN